MKLHIALIALLAVVDHSSSRAVLATTKTSEYKTEYETTPKQEQEGDVAVVAPLLPTLLRGAKKAVYQFLSDGDGDNEELAEYACFGDNAYCCADSQCCSNHCNAWQQCFTPQE